MKNFKENLENIPEDLLFEDDFQADLFDVDYSFDDYTA